MDIIAYIKDKIQKKALAKKKAKIEERERYENYKRVIEQEDARLSKGDPEPPTAFMSLRSINKIYDNMVQAVYDFNLDIEKGEFIVFVGPSGCGKSTTLRMIAGLEDITAGDLFIDGVYSNTLEPIERNTAMVFQNYALYPHLTVHENLAIGLRAMKVPAEDESDPKKTRHLTRQEIDERIERVAGILELKDYLKRQPRQLSGGQCQRVALGRAIVKDAKVFLMDEPLSNLDAKLRVQMRSEIIRLHNQLHATTIYVTHDQVEAMTMADRIVVMDKGVVQQIGKPEDIYENPANKFVASFMGNPAMNLLEATYDKGTITVGDLSFKLSPKDAKKHDEFYENLLDEYRHELVDNDEKNAARNEILEKIEALKSDGSPKGEKKLAKARAQLELLEESNARKNFLIDAIQKLEEIIRTKKHPLTFAIRPEHISVQKPTSALALEAHLDVVELLGDEYSFHFAFAGKDVQAKTPKKKTYVANSDVTLYIDLAKKHLFDDISGRKIL